FSYLTGFFVFRGNMDNETNTSGGPYVGGDVNTGGGDFIGGDKIVIEFSTCLGKAFTAQLLGHW
ncbi:MAG: hypothetical protein ACJ788_26315, partial [Ktedonobacteraceae bacterium]